MRKFCFIASILFFAFGSCNAHFFGNSSYHKTANEITGYAKGDQKGSKVKKPQSAAKAKKKQEDKDKKLKKDYIKSVKESQKRTVEIQTPEVQDRMLKNKKDTEIRDKMKKKKVKASTKKAGKKYK